MAAFERMEEKVEAMEATGGPRQSWQGLIWKASSLPWRVAPMSTMSWQRPNQLKGGRRLWQLPASDDSNAVKEVKVEEVDADLEDLKRSIDKL